MGVHFAATGLFRLVLLKAVLLQEQTPDNPDRTTPLLIVFAVLALGGFLAAFYIANRMRKVQEGHIAVVHWMDRFSRTVGAGPYWLRPFEDEVAQVYVRQREATASLPNIFTEGGLPVTVNLRYAYRLDPNRMATDELYYSDAERRSQQEMLMREVLLDLVQELSPPANAAAAGGASAPRDEEPLDVVTLFSPFAGPKAPIVRSSLKERMSEALLAHGIAITGAPVQIAGLALPPDLSAVFGEFMGARFSSSARAEIIRRVRAAAPNISETGLVHLLNIIQNPSAEIQTIFTTGMVNQDMLLDDSGAVLRQRLGGAVVQPPQQPMPPAPAEPPPAEPPGERPSEPAATPTRPAIPIAQPPATAAAPWDDADADPDYPLVESDNLLLKSTRRSQADTD
jgi:hypothetical protein